MGELTPPAPILPDKEGAFMETRVVVRTVVRPPPGLEKVRARDGRRVWKHFTPPGLDGR
jgi:hypothetical protein